MVVSTVPHCYVFPHLSCRSVCGLAFATANPKLERVMLDCHVALHTHVWGLDNGACETLSEGWGGKLPLT
jgi:hypothetical protein